jgi:hypothetical protein
MRISLIQMCQTCGYDTMIDAECSIEGGRCLCPLIPPTPFSHTGRRGSVDVLMPETGDGTQALDHAPACAGEEAAIAIAPEGPPTARPPARAILLHRRTHQRLQSPLAGLRPRARWRGRGAPAIEIAPGGPPTARPPARAILLHRLTHQRWTSPLKGLRPVARRRGRSSFTASRTSD